ncbi:MAG TPA: C1 family peptidase [Chitinophagaceae bacterium]|nr:C1 family peptidase [Chitinophagaceae bacterium]
MKLLRSFLLFSAIIMTGTSFAQSAYQEWPGKIHLIDSVQCTSVKDQGQSPTCWVFGTNSLFESDMIKKYHLQLNLSEMFIARYAYIDKAITWLASGGKTYFEGGGQFHDVIRVVEHYGMVPEEAYTGRPYGNYSHNHAGLDTAMKRYLQSVLDKGISKLSDIEVANINDTLDKYLGKVPERFWFDNKEYSARSFAKELIHFGDDYAELVSFADQPLYKKFILKDKYNWALDSFQNLELDDMLMVVDTALARGWSVGWEGDVTEKEFNFYAGFAAFPDSQHHYDQERLDNYKDESTERDHMLQIVGVGRDANNKKWYYLKNSWGKYFSKFDGYIYMDENYFRLKTVILFVNKEGLPVSIRSNLHMN